MRIAEGDVIFGSAHVVLKLHIKTKTAVKIMILFFISTSNSNIHRIVYQKKFKKTLNK